MCGIAGFVKLNGSTNSTSVKRVAFRLLRQIAERGDKATGYAYAGKHGLKVVKDKVGVKKFLKLYEREIKRDVGKAQAWIAHSRLPSSGSIQKPANNHPIFTKGGLAIVHNGIVYNADEVYEHFGLERDCEVDSEAILKLIEHQRAKTTNTGEAITQAMKYLDGSLTFALIDEASPSEVWLHKWGYSAPVSVVVSDGLVVFASEFKHVLGAIGRKSDKDFFRLPANSSVRLLQDGELLRINKYGVNLLKTAPESEAIHQRSQFFQTTLVKGDPDDDEVWGYPRNPCPISRSCYYDGDLDICPYEGDPERCPYSGGLIKGDEFELSP